jgi:ferric-dicitrate binding protein FerR (iron transport regulator)
LVAAVAILLIIGGLLFLSVQDEMGGEKNIKIIAEKNQLYVLPDSTKVWMQPGSSIRYAKAFMQDRRVWLVGNSLFEVQKHKGSTFQVYINDAFIEVKGTCFLVKQEDAYCSEVTLFEGEIEFNILSTCQKTAMLPLQKLTYNSMDSQTQIDNIANISWENGRYNLKDVPLDQLIQIVSRMYHTDILMEGVHRDEVSFSGSIHYNESLDNVLNKIRFSLNLNIRKVDDRFILY